ncbi:diguanylate cyclase [Acetobacter sp. AN02]|uniref:diguanylate cyclase domain-containing protein n=1 Tax=Acetobacter sp. AN02 TaxID=2894186 RepID=UPI0024341337|nr:diguanylate cyclase [Acetobacter sp. AN02]MDG6095557.1 diguanylate cyclase [Acetobacter sp. AN02]
MARVISGMAVIIMLGGLVSYLIDDMPVAVMTVKPGTLKISYVNETSRELIRSIEHLLPVSADNLIGTSIDVFHHHPEHQRAILGDPANLPHNARIRLGSEILDLKISAVYDDRSVYLGPMLTWALATKEIEAENRIRQLARYDSLTGIANRNTFQEKLQDVLADSQSRFSLIFIDLDGFKAVNVSARQLGHGSLLPTITTALKNSGLEPGRLEIEITETTLFSDEAQVLSELRW